MEIYRQAVNLFNLPVAAALSLWQILFTFILMLFYTRTQARISRPLRLGARRAIERPVRTGREKLLVYGNAAAILVLIGAPLLALVGRSLRGASGPTLAYYRALFTNRDDSLFFVPPAEAIGNSVAIALAAMLLAVTLGVLSAQLLTHWERRPGGATGRGALLARLLDPLLMLPLATSAVTLGFGYIVAMGPLRASPWLVPVAHSLIALPFVVRTFLPALRALDRRLGEAAATLGAGPLQSWWTIDAPLLARALAISAAFAFAISLGEFGATLLIARPDTPHTRLAADPDRPPLRPSPPGQARL